MGVRICSQRAVMAHRRRVRLAVQGGVGPSAPRRPAQQHGPQRCTPDRVGAALPCGREGVTARAPCRAPPRLLRPSGTGSRPGRGRPGWAPACTRSAAVLTGWGGHGTLHSTARRAGRRVAARRQLLPAPHREQDGAAVQAAGAVGVVAALLGGLAVHGALGVLAQGLAVLAEADHPAGRGIDCRRGRRRQPARGRA